MSRPLPPKWADRFLSWFVSEELIEEIQGDLHEAYYHRVQKLGFPAARRAYCRDVFRFFRPYAFEKYSRLKQFSPMYRNYFKIAIRNIWRRKSFTLVNLTALSAGISAVLLIWLFLSHEWSYDQHVPQADRIFRINNQYREQTYSCMQFANFSTSSPEEQTRLVNYLKSFDGVAAAAHFVCSRSAISPQEQYFIQTTGKEIVVNNVLFTNTGADFQAIFPPEYLAGSLQQSLTGPGKMVLSEKIARQLWGEAWLEISLGNTSVAMGDRSYQLTGIVKNPPGNQHFSYDVMVSTDTMPSWGAYTYLKLQPDVDITGLTQQFNRSIDQVYPGYTQDELSKGITYTPLTRIHFETGALYELKPAADLVSLRAFAVIVLIILLVIWTNYANLAMAMYADRQREIGLRKVMGAVSWNISLQLIAEAVLLALLSLPLIVFLVWWTTPYFAGLMDIDMDPLEMWQPRVLLLLLSLLLLTGLFSGLYPALRYSRKAMIPMLKGTPQGGMIIRRLNFRSLTLTVQFTVVVGLLGLAFIIHRQMAFVQQRDLGFNREGILYFPVQTAADYNMVKSRLLDIPGVLAAGVGDVPGNELYNQSTYQLKGQNQVFSDGTEIYTTLDALQTLGIDCPPCKNISEGQSRLFLVNQKAAEQLSGNKMDSAALLTGQTLVLEPEWENEEYGNGIPHTISGILGNFQYFSMRYDHQPLFIHVIAAPRYISNLLVKIDMTRADWYKSLHAIEEVYRSLAPDRPFDAVFLEDRLDQLYQAEKRSGTLMNALSLLALVLAMLGLGAIASYIAFNRQKEMGIRKVLGASSLEVLLLLNKDFMLLTVVSVVLAAPFTLWFGNQWLNNFAFHITPGISHLLAAGLGTALVVAAVVSLRSLRTASQAPVESIKQF